jgi:quercetin dioxygenase-like cupin family protein
MGYSLTRWAGTDKPSRNSIRRQFEQEGLISYSWMNRPGDHYDAHSHVYKKVLYCIEGGIVFHVDGESVSLTAGDRLEIDPETTHSADVGPEGVTCMEAAKG